MSYQRLRRLTGSKNTYHHRIHPVHTGAEVGLEPVVYTDTVPNANDAKEIESKGIAQKESSVADAEKIPLGRNPWFIASAILIGLLILLFAIYLVLAKWAFSNLWPFNSSSPAPLKSSTGYAHLGSEEPSPSSSIPPPSSSALPFSSSLLPPSSSPVPSLSSSSPSIPYCPSSTFLSSLGGTTGTTCSNAMQTWYNVTVPSGCPLSLSTDVIGFQYANNPTSCSTTYGQSDSWYCSWALDNNLYCTFEDNNQGSFANSVGTFYGSSGYYGTVALTGSNPLSLTVGTGHTIQTPNAPYWGRYVSGSLYKDGVWYTSTYPTQTGDPYGNECAGINGNCAIGWTASFETSSNQGSSFGGNGVDPYYTLNSTSTFNVFGQDDGYVNSGGPQIMKHVKFTAGHFVDFGQNMQWSPDGKAYYHSHSVQTSVIGTSNPLTWNLGDVLYLARVVLNPSTINQVSVWEFWCGSSTGWVFGLPGVACAVPIINWPGRVGASQITYSPVLNKYLVTVTSAPHPGSQGFYPYGTNNCDPFDIWFGEADTVTGPYRLIQYLNGFGPNAYFPQIYSKFMDSNFTSGHFNFALSYSGYIGIISPTGCASTNPPLSSGYNYGLNLIVSQFNLSIPFSNQLALQKCTTNPPMSSSSNPISISSSHPPPSSAAPIPSSSAPPSGTGGTFTTPIPSQCILNGDASASVFTIGTDVNNPDSPAGGDRDTYNYFITSDPYSNSIPVSYANLTGSITQINLILTSTCLNQNINLYVLNSLTATTANVLYAVTLTLSTVSTGVSGILFNTVPLTWQGPPTGVTGTFINASITVAFGLFGVTIAQQNPWISIGYYTTSPCNGLYTYTNSTLTPYGSDLYYKNANPGTTVGTLSGIQIAGDRLVAFSYQICPNISIILSTPFTSNYNDVYSSYPHNQGSSQSITNSALYFPSYGDVGGYINYDTSSNPYYLNYSMTITFYLTATETPSNTGSVILAGNSAYVFTAVSPTVVWVLGIGQVGSGASPCSVQNALQFYFNPAIETFCSSSAIHQNIETKVTLLWIYPIATLYLNGILDSSYTFEPLYIPSTAVTSYCFGCANTFSGYINSTIIYRGIIQP